MIVVIFFEIIRRLVKELIIFIEYISGSKTFIERGALEISKISAEQHKILVFISVGGLEPISRTRLWESLLYTH